MMRFRSGLAILAALVFWLCGPALAWDPPISVEVGKSKLVRLKDDDEPAVVFVGNPVVADVIIERSGVLFVLGREPGETDVWILDEEGQPLMHRALVVTTLTSRQVTVSRGGAAVDQTLSCVPRCSVVPTPIGDGAGPTSSQSGTVFSNPPQPEKAPSTEQLIESLRELIPDLGQAPSDSSSSSTE